MQFKADYYNGINPQPVAVTVRVSKREFVFKTAGGIDALTARYQRHAIEACNIEPPLGHGRRLIDLPNGGRLETNYQAIESGLPSNNASLFGRALHYAENHKLVILMSLVAVVLASLFLLKYGVPTLAKYSAKFVPASTEHQLGQQTMDTLDNEKLGYFKPSKLNQSRQEAIRLAVKHLCDKSNTCPNYELNFRHGGRIGANALALPGGFMVITDALVKLANNDDEIVAVLAHELGHVKQRHALRQVLQGTISGLIIVAVTGDLSSIAAGLPTLLINMHYTRALETEADNYALHSLNMACIPAKHFASILVRLSQSHGNPGGKSMPEILASHPDTKKRILPFLDPDPTCESNI